MIHTTLIIRLTWWVFLQRWWVVFGHLEGQNRLLLGLLLADIYMHNATVFFDRYFEHLDSRNNVHSRVSLYFSPVKVYFLSNLLNYLNKTYIRSRSMSVNAVWISGFFSLSKVFQCSHWLKYYRLLIGGKTWLVRINTVEQSLQGWLVVHHWWSHHVRFYDFCFSWWEHLNHLNIKFEAISRWNNRIYLGGWFGWDDQHFFFWWVWS